MNLRPTTLLILICAVSCQPAADKPATNASSQTKSPPVDSAKPATPAVTRPTATGVAPPKDSPVEIPPLGNFARSTLSGVYTADEAHAGRDMYLGLCASCHTAVSHTGPEFRRKWAGRPLADLFTFMRTMMPKNEPASLADEDYQVLLAYILQLNRMPPGKTPLSTDSLVLAKIRIDTARTARPKSSD